MNQAIDLHLTVSADLLRLTVANKSDKALRFWARNNSWGWSMFSILLAPQGSTHWTELTAKPIRWTANFPQAMELPVGGRLDFELRYQDPGWEDLANISASLNQPLQVKARLHITETPEALAQEVFVGEIYTEPSLSLPPHFWLFGQPR